MRGLFLLAPATLLLAGGLAFGQEDEESADAVTPPLKHPSRHFVVDGRDLTVNQRLMRWVEQTAARVEQVAGQPVPFDNRCIHVVVRALRGGATNTATVTEGRIAGIGVQRLSLPDSSDQVLETAREPLCRLLLAGFFAGRPVDGRSAATAATPVPRWFSIGVSENLYPSLKAKNSGQVLMQWRAGQLTSVAGLLKAQAEPGKEPDPAVCGAWMTWMLSRSDRQECFGKIVERIKTGESLSAKWFVPLVPGCRTVADLDEQWDNWMLQQRHTVYDPGLITADFLVQIESELALYPGESGIPLSTNLGARIELRDLPARRNEPWISQVARDKGASVRILAAGRGKDLQDVLESYGRFFDALGKKRTPTKTLEDLLSAADGARDRLRAKAEAVEHEAPL